MELELTSFHLEKFFITREGLWVSDDLKEYIISVAKPIKKSKVETSSVDLKKSMNDYQIREIISKNRVFGSSEFCLCLKDKIVAQSEGERGELLTSRSLNIFYVNGKNNEVLVTVGWSTNLREWRVYLYGIDRHKWRKGDRVFYPTN
ncbi:hypothetical protein KJ603_00270 [Patescibacteria group bacterium]|nr:hypothetical protein [Patescibacteria group bacterium]